ncbi:hypothetical protein B0H14DRAFT_2893398 [Mycena olivaceomarginata]|nr:hypothetical protein B0H14DRAFT_2893398 [Mycena olivaceomarginata]
MNGMNPLQVPELLREIAAFVESPRSLSSFAQVDRFVSAAVTPCLFRNIEVDLSSIGSLAQALCNEPERASSCRSLSFRGHREKADWDYSAIQKLHTNIITIFGVIFTHGRLASLKWTWRSRQTPFSEEVWQAISSVAGSLQELDISILEEEDDTWVGPVHSHPHVIAHPHQECPNSSFECTWMGMWASPIDAQHPL